MPRVLPLALLGLLAACAPPCPGADRPVDDDEPISGVTGDEVVPLEDGPFSLALEWRSDDSLTEASGEIEVDPGTGRRVNTRFCTPGCLAFNRPAVPCAPDQLRHDARARVTTGDGRIDGSLFEGQTAAHRRGGELLWSFSGEVAWDELERQGTLTLDDLDVKPRYTVSVVRVWIAGDETGPIEVSFDFLSDSDTGSSATALGSTPEPEPTR